MTAQGLFQLNGVIPHWKKGAPDLEALPTHLQYLLAACELLKQMQNGREIFYSVNPEKVKEVAEWAEQFRQLWDERFNKLETIMKKYQ